jgi:hypothetical protein
LKGVGVQMLLHSFASVLLEPKPPAQIGTKKKGEKTSNNGKSME